MDDYKKAAESSANANVPKEEAPKVEPKPEEKPVEEPKPEESKPVEPKAEPAKKPVNTPARVNGRFVSSKNAAPKPAEAPKNSSRWTKDSNPSANKKRAAGGDK